MYRQFIQAIVLCVTSSIDKPTIECYIADTTVDRLSISWTIGSFCIRFSDPRAKYLLKPFPFFSIHLFCVKASKSKEDWNGEGSILINGLVYFLPPLKIKSKCKAYIFIVDFAAYFVLTRKYFIQYSIAKYRINCSRYPSLLPTQK